MRIFRGLNMDETSGVYERITRIRCEKISEENLTAEDVLNLIRQTRSWMPAKA